MNEVFGLRERHEKVYKLICIEHLVLCQVPKQWFLTRGGVVPQETFGNVWR